MSFSILGASPRKQRSSSADSYTGSTNRNTSPTVKFDNRVDGMETEFDGEDDEGRQFTSAFSDKISRLSE